MRLQKIFGLLSMLMLMLSVADWQPTAVAKSEKTENSAEPQKYALLIGVEGYSRGRDEDAEWWALQTAPDVAALKNVLVRKFGFKATDIKTLQTKETTTRASIEQGFKDLIAKVKPGDIVYLHYSGHGVQVADDNGDEIDGLDETLVPSDYVSRKDGSNNIRDDEIGSFIDQLKAKNPASVMFTFDSCFSGTITRGGGRFVERGESYKGKRPRPKPGAVEKSGLLENATTSNGFVVISATRSDQTAKETDDDKDGSMGALTYALVKALDKAAPTTTYKDIYESVQTTVGQRVESQNPQIEGSVDNVVMRGLAIPSQPYIKVSVDDNENAILQAGSIQGMTKGSRFAILPNGAKAADEPTKFADAEIVELDAATALLKLTPVAGKKIDKNLLPTARAFETEHKYGDNPLKVLVSNGTFPQKTEITADLQKFPLVALTTKEDWDIKIEDAAGKISLVRADGSKLADIENAPDATKKVRGALERAERFRVLRGLENTTTDISIEMRIVPVECETNQRGQCSKVLRDKETQKNTDGQPILNEGDFFQLEFRNTGKLDAFVTALELTSNGKINPLFPHPSVAMPDNKIISDGNWKRIKEPFIFKVSSKDPAGKYIYKAVATRDFTDFSPLLDAQVISRGDLPEGTRGSSESKKPLGKLLRAATAGQRSELGGSNPPDWATATTTYEIVLKK